MIKALLFPIIIFGFLCNAFSQSAYEGIIEYDKKKQEAFIKEFPFPPEAVENALMQKMEERGYRTKTEKGLFNKDKGVVVHKSAFITEVNEKSMDYMFKVEPRSKKDKSGSILYMVVMKDGENARSTLNEEGVQKVKSFLDSMDPQIENSHVDLKAKAQAEGVGKAEKKYKTLQENQARLEKKIKELQLELDNNLREQVIQQKEIENQKKLLDEIIGQKKEVR